MQDQYSTKKPKKKISKKIKLTIPIYEQSFGEGHVFLGHIVKSPRKLVEYSHALLIGRRHVHYGFCDVFVGQGSPIKGKQLAPC